VTAARSCREAACATQEAPSATADTAARSARILVTSRSPAYDGNEVAEATWGRRPRGEHTGDERFECTAARLSDPGTQRGAAAVAVRVERDERRGRSSAHHPTSTSA
jgi:hypothetical protein